MLEITFSGLLYFAIFVTLFALLKPQINLDCLTLAFVYLIVLLALANLNFAYDIIEQKFASEMAYLRYVGTINQFNENFLVQAWVSSLAFMATDAWEAAIGVNIAILAAMAIYADRLRMVYILIFLSPAIIHISMFALRDVVLAATMFYACQYIFSSDRPKLLSAPVLVILVLIFMQRPEILAIVFLSLGLIYFREYTSTQKISIVLLFSIVAVFALPYFPMLLGYPGTVPLTELPDFVLRFFEARADRWDSSEGGSTNILNGNLTSVPFVFRYPLQVWTFIVAPLPTDFRSPLFAIFLFDSIFFIVILREFWRKADHRHKTFLVVYICVNAFFMANYGNLFRMRMPCFLIMFSGILAYYRAFQPLPETPRRPPADARPAE